MRRNENNHTVRLPKKTSQLSAGKEATALCHKKGRYMRDICIVYVNGVDVSLAQLDAALACVYRQYLGEVKLPPN